MRFSHVFLSRPQPQADELAAMLEPLGVKTVVQPAFTYQAVDAAAQQPAEMDALATALAGSLVLFTSPRAVAFGLAQLPAAVLTRCRIGAIGPATARALADNGLRVSLTPRNGYTSEALLETLGAEGAGHHPARPQAFIIAAPDGRDRLASGLAELGWSTCLLLVYRPVAAALEKTALAELEHAKGLLSIWTSANVMKALSHRLPPAAWFRICQGDWLVISERLRRLARAYGPPAVHLAPGPGNQDILNAVRGLL